MATEPFDLDSLTWTCHVCGEDRPDRLISVLRTEVPFGGRMVAQNVRYCNDRPGCAAGAPKVRFLRDPAAEQE